MSEMLDPVERARSSDEYKIAKEQIADQDWRLDNLYWIQNADGEEIQSSAITRSASFCASQ